MFIEIKVTASCVVSMGAIAMVASVKADVRHMVARQQWQHQDTFLPQVSHKKLQTNQCKDTEAKHCQDHDISQLFHCLDEGSNNRLQT